MNLILGLDAGTHGVRVLALDPVRRSIIASVGRDYPRTCAAGVQEMSPQVLWQMCALALEDILKSLPAGARVEALGITHQRGTVIPVDEAGRALGPALCDSDSRAATAEELASLGLDTETYYQCTGCPFVSFNGMAKILWARFHAPALYEKAAAWLSPQDYLISVLTGHVTVTEGSASRNGCLLIRDPLPPMGLRPSGGELRERLGRSLCASGRGTDHRGARGSAGGGGWQRRSSGWSDGHESRHYLCGQPVP